MSFDAGRFMAQANEYLKQANERRFSQAPSKEQVEYHLEVAEKIADALDTIVIYFCYESSWLEENAQRHPLEEDARKRINRLLNRSKSMAGMLTPIDEEKPKA